MATRTEHIVSGIETRRSEPSIILEHNDRLTPAAAGLFAGAPGGVVALLAASQFSQARGGGDLVVSLGHFATRGALGGDDARAVSVVLAVSVGAVLGMSFAVLTRPLRKFFPMLVWALIFFPALWTAAYALLVPRIAPSLAGALPYLPMLVGSCAFAVLAALQVPLRVRHAHAEWTADRG